MIERSHFPFKYHMLLYPMAMVLTIWLVYWFEMQLDTDFSSWGVLPRNAIGLRGVLFSPFIHGDGFHLLHNTLPLLVLSTSLFYFYDLISFKVLLYGTLFTGLLTWVIGRESYHIGASGVIYLLFGFLSLKGLISKHFRLLAVSFFVIFMYGSMVWYVTPVDYKISWEGHLSGFLTGIAFAFLFRNNIAEPPIYRWEIPVYNNNDDDEFMKCFDAQGNFIPTSERLANEIKKIEDENNDNLNKLTTTTTANPVRLIYHHIPSKNKKRIYKY